MPRPLRGDRERNPAPEYTEWVEHQYDPGYWVGRIPPFLRAGPKDRQRNPYGYLLVVSALVTALLDIALVRKDATNIPNGIMAGVLAVWQLVAGVKLLRLAYRESPPS